MSQSQGSGSGGNGSSDSATFSLVIGLGLLSLAVAILVWGVKAHSGYNIRPDAMDRVMDLLGALLIIAVFVERAQEVFVATRRSIDRATIDREVKRCQDRLDNFAFPDQQDKKEALQEALGAAKDRFEQFRFQTRKQTFIMGVILGVAIALVSPTILDQAFMIGAIAGDATKGIVAVDAASVNSFQTGLFRVLDVILTGLLIGGGSEAVHKIMALFLDFTKRLRTQSAGTGGKTTG